jgi:hypothetical protein
MPYVFGKGPAELVGPFPPQPHKDSTRATQVSVPVVYGNAVLLPTHHRFLFYEDY